jgi:uncharacterized protein
MSRDPNDIPEVFRRAMRDAGWDYGQDEADDGRPPTPPRTQRTEQPPESKRTLLLAGALLLLFLSFNWVVRTYTDWLWFQELSYVDVWLKQFFWRIGLFLVGLVIALVVFGLNWHLARKRAIASTSPLQPQLLKIPGAKWAVWGAVAFFSFIFGSSLSAQWEQFLLFINRTPYGIAEPIFNQDVSFYLFTLPIYQLLQDWAGSLFFFALGGSLLLYAGNSLPEIQQGRWRPHTIPAVRQHIALLLFFLLGVWAVGYRLNMYQLLYSPGGAVTGVTYTDMAVTLWALRAQLLFMGLAAVVALFNVFRYSLRPLLATAALWVVATIVLGGLIPGLVQRYAVEPNELERERPFIAHNIKFTRLAFGLDEVITYPLNSVEPLTEEVLGDEKTETILRNIRIWDYRLLQRTYEQLQALRPYYQFSEVDIDRYIIDGELRQVMLATRELNKANLNNPTWVNRSLEFTHGFGVVMNPVNETTNEGQPRFFVQDLPPVSSVAEIQITRPEVYYGELMPDVVYVNNTRASFSYPSGTENVTTIYQGDGGVPIDSFLKRLAFAIRLTDANIILSDEIDSNSRVMLYRTVRERVTKIAPFLALDRDPYIVIRDDGRLFWILDAYTISDKFPYATRADQGLNYIRNSVKITIDAYNGTVTFYLTEVDDPIIQAYAGAFPNLFQPLGSAPEDLLRHVRYPETLFKVQAQLYMAYHMTDERVFYNQEDLWRIPNEIFDGKEQVMEPYYVIMPLPGTNEPEFLLIQPVTPAGKMNMIAWMAARSDFPNYGQMVVYELPKQELVFGPMQMEARINQDPRISQQFSLWDQGGSRVIRGNLIVVPVGNSFLYVEPVYLLSSNSALPELRRVIVATDTRISMQPTIGLALAALLRDVPGQIIAAEEEGIITGEGFDVSGILSPTAVPPTIFTPIDGTIEELIQAANRHYQAAEQAQRNGDWATYGAELSALEQVLEQLLLLSDQGE